MGLDDHEDGVRLWVRSLSVYPKLEAIKEEGDYLYH